MSARDLLFEVSSVRGERRPARRAGVEPRSPRLAALAAMLLAAACAHAPAGAPTAALPDAALAGLRQALAARRALDGPGELQALLGVARDAPRTPLASLALRRVAELAGTAPALAEATEAGLAPLVSSGELDGPAAARARTARAISAEVLGDHAAAARQRAENGAVTAWTLSGPFVPLRVMDFDVPVPPEQGVLPAEVTAPAGLPPFRTRAMPATDGTLSLEGEPGLWDGYALVTDAELARGGAYLLVLNTELSARLWVDGRVVLERRTFAGNPPSNVALPVTLAAGRHRLVLRVARLPGSRNGVHVSLARQDGAPSDARFTAPPGTGSVPFGAPGEGRLPPAAGPVAPVLAPRALVEALAPSVGPALARVLAARDAMVSDREAARTLLAEAAALEPQSPLVNVALAAALQDAPGLDARVSAGKAEAALRRALEADPGHAEARVALARLLSAQERRDDADEVLAGLGAADAARPAALVQRARVTLERGLAEPAEALVTEALAAGPTCDVAEVGLDVAERLDAVARADERVAVLARCRGGREQLAAHLRKRGDPAGAVAALDPLLAVRPWDVKAGLARADALVAEARPAEAAARLEALAALWPRSDRVLTALGDARELAGDRAGAREAREAALRSDGSDLQLRRALALEDGREALDDLAEDGAEAIRRYRQSKPAGGVSSALVLDAAAVELHPGGAATERTHQITHVLDQGGVDRLGEVSLPSGAQVITLRTLKPDGRSLEPEQAGKGKGSISLAGLEPGDLIETEYLRSLPAHAEGGTPGAFFFQEVGEAIVRSTYVVRAPAGLGLAVEGAQMPSPAVKRDGPFEVVRAEKTGVPALLPEPGAPPTTEWIPFVTAGVGGGWETVARGGGDAIAEKTRPTPELRALADEIRAAAGKGASPEVLARAAYAKVQRTILGTGSNLGEEASAVLSRGRGSRLHLLGAVLELLGMPVRVAVVRPFTADPTTRRFPASSTWSAPLLRVQAGATTLWLDPSSRGMPFGGFDDDLAGCEALVLPAPGEAPRLERTPARPAVPDAHELRARIVLAQDGSAELEGTMAYTGASAAELRDALEPLEPVKRRQGFELLLARQFPGLTVTEVALAGEDDPEQPLSIHWLGRAPGVARQAEAGGLEIDAPLFPSLISNAYVQLASRTLPLLVEREPEHQRIELVPPAGMRIAVAPPRRVETPFGRFERTERQEGEALVREERLELERGRVPPERYGEFARFAASIDGIQQEPVRVTQDASTRGVISPLPPPREK